MRIYKYTYVHINKDTRRHAIPNVSRVPSRLYLFPLRWYYSDGEREARAAPA